jgi:hypothetical protein
MRKTTLSLHVSEVEAAYVDGIASRSIVELGGCISEDLPVEEHGCILSGLGTDQVISDDIDADTCGTNVLLSTSIHDGILLPRNRTRAEVGGHVADQGHTLRDLVEGEFGSAWELNTMNGLVVAIVEIGSGGVDVPLVSIGDSVELGAAILPHLNGRR